MNDSQFIGSIIISMDKFIKLLSECSPLKIECSNAKITGINIKDDSNITVDIEITTNNNIDKTKDNTYVFSNIKPTPSTQKTVVGGTIISCNGLFDKDNLRDDVLLTTYQAEILLGMQFNLLHNLRYKGEGPAFIKEGKNKYWYKVCDIRNWINEKHVKSV